MKRKVPIEDRIEIEELMARYAWALDTGDREGYVSLFTEDGWIQHWPQGRCQGRDAIRGLTDSLWYSRPNHYLGRQHRMSQVIMTPEEDDVRIRCFWSILQHDVETSKCFVFGLGTWNTLVTRDVDGEWRFREVDVDIWRGDGVPWVGEQRAWKKHAGPGAQGAIREG